ncbi:MAG: hypothetical protein HOW73_41160 [Polyangiaceae bacterium]|nr:hypothetical protein [Polyangiaceae bacterium]
MTRPTDLHSRTKRLIKDDRLVPPDTVIWFDRCAKWADGFTLRGVSSINGLFHDSITEPLLHLVPGELLSNLSLLRLVEGVTRSKPGPAEVTVVVTERTVWHDTPREVHRTAMRVTGELSFRDFMSANEAAPKTETPVVRLAHTVFGGVAAYALGALGGTARVGGIDHERANEESDGARALIEDYFTRTDDAVRDSVSRVSLRVHLLPRNGDGRTLESKDSKAHHEVCIGLARHLILRVGSPNPLGVAH